MTVLGTDERGAIGTYPLTVTIAADTQAPNVAVFANPGRVNLGQAATVQVFATDNVGVTFVSLTADGVPVTLDSFGVATLPTTHVGVVHFVATAKDRAGNTTTANGSLNVADPSDTTAPVVIITSPQSDSVVTYLTEIRGTVTDANLNNYRVEISRFDTNDWKTIATGTTNIPNGVLATFDPTLLDNDDYTARIVATDVNGQETVITFGIAVEGQAKLGNFRQEFVDLNIPVAGIPIQITRVYDTLKADQSGDFGFGWSLGTGYDPRVRETRPVNEAAEKLVAMFGANPFKDGTRVYVNAPDGRRVGFTFEAKPYSGELATLSPGTFGGFYVPYFRPDPGVFMTLEGEYDASKSFVPLPIQKRDGLYYLPAIGVPYNPLGYKLTTKDGLTYHFNQFSGIQDITDRNDVKLTFTREGITSSMGPGITFTRDADGRIQSITDPNGGKLSYQYDANGNLLGAKDQIGKEEQYAYELPAQSHYLSTVTSVCGCYPSMRMDYDAGGRLIGEKNALNQATTYGYNLANFTETTADALNRVTTLGYDARGNVTSKTDPLGRSWTMAYDAADNETSMTDTRSFTTSKTFDWRGNNTQTTDAAGFIRTTTYNDLNLPVSMTNARGNTTTMAYDPQGRQVATIDPTSATTSSTYDGEGRTLVSVDATGRTIMFGYSYGFRTALRTDYADGTTSYVSVNWLDEAVSQIDSLGNETQTVYDDTGKPTSTRDSRGFVTTFVYDSNERLERVVDSLGNVTRYEYDQANRETAEVTGTGTRAWEYDAAGQVIRMTDRNGRVKQVDYDLAGRPIEERWYASDTASATVDVLHYGFDLADNLTLVTDSDSKIENEFNSRNLLTVSRQYGSAVTPQLVLTYSYDANQNVVGVADQSGTTTISTYTVRDELASRSWTVLGADSFSATFEYDAFGRTTLTRRTSNGVSAGETRRVYNSVGILGQLAHTGNAGQVFESTQYQYDGTVRLIGEQRSTQNVSYGYDSDTQLTSAKYSTQANESFAYDALGNRQGTVVGPHNRVLSDARFRYGYDNEGNLTRKTELASGEVTEYAFDHRNRLVSVVRSSAGGIILNEVGYRYDGLNRLVERNGNGSVLRTSYDGEHAWSDADASGTIQARYLFGDRIDSVLARWQPANGSAWYLTDHLGTVRQIINGAGAAVLNAVEYSAFGEIVSQTNPAAGDRFAFTGREWEAASRLYYYRARFYDAAIGRFVSQDPIGFNGGDGNLYRYVGNVSTMYSDPLGLATSTEEGTLDSKIATAAQRARLANRANTENRAMLAKNRIYELIKKRLSANAATKESMVHGSFTAAERAELMRLTAYLESIAPNAFWRGVAAIGRIFGG